ncbi:MAG: hypothetical protein COA99_06520 [Moraxellaceae bacterium]|nr:MAG: hypothetical protein COA99_06520 [Moraxellaceae bacterium]
MAITSVDFSAFADKHIYEVSGAHVSSDVMSAAVQRLTGRATLRLGVKKKNKLTGQFHADVISDNRATYRSGTTINGIIALTTGALAAWTGEIIKQANANTDDEFICSYDILSAAGITTSLSNKKSYGSNLNLTGGYGVKAEVLVKKSGTIATVVHLHGMDTITQAIPSVDLQNQSAILTSTFLEGLAAL